MLPVDSEGAPLRGRRGRAPLALALVAALAAAAPAGAGAAATFPLAVSSDGRYLVDQAGVPFQIRGDAPWDLLMVSVADATTYLDARQAQGFNALLTSLMEHRNWGNLPNVPRTCAAGGSCAAGPLPFTAKLGGGSYTANTDVADLSTPNTAYFDAVDAILDAAATRGFLVILSPFYLGYGAPTSQAANNEGWSAEAAQNPTASCTTFGTFLGNRYKARANLLWSWVSDANLTAGSAQETCSKAVMAALRAAGATQPYTAHLVRGLNSTDSTGESSTGTWQVDAAYVRPTSDGGTPFTQGRRAYASGPAFVLEDYYENDGHTTTTRATLRYQAWGDLLSTTGGYVYGNSPVWFAGSGWLSSLNTTGATDAVAAFAAADAYGWWRLGPTTSLCAAGCGSEAGNDYVPQAISTSATTAVLYVPPAHSGAVTVDLSRLAGTVAARWRDPVSGATTAIGTYAATGTQAFTPPGANSASANDWALLLEPSAAAPLAIAPASASVPPRGRQQFTASGGSGTGYAWSLTASPSGGTIDPTGLYTAGSVGSVTDVVQLRDSLGATTTRNVTVTAAVGISPATVTLPPRGRQQFAASGGSGTGYAWSLTATPSGGTIDPSGLYTAGSVGSVTDVVQLRDSLGATTTRNVTVTAAVAISPGTVTLPPRGRQQFTATGGSGTGYAWSLAASPSGGTIDPTGLYTAGLVGGVIDVVQLRDSVGGTTTRSVTVTAAVAIAPATVTVPPRGRQQFTASAGSGTGYAWSLTASPSGGTIDPTGLYTAGPVGGVTDVVQVRDSLGGTTTRSVTVTAGVSINPPVTSVAPGAAVPFSATGGSGTGWAWSLQANASGASLDAASGAYVAGGAAGSDVVRVVDSLGNSATAQVTVTANPLVISPASLTLPPRGSRRFTASGGSGTGYAWSLTASPSGGAIDPAGLYTAGPVGSVTDVIQLRDSLGAATTRNVTVTAAVSIAPATVTLPPRGRQQFTASGGSGTPYAWSLTASPSGGTIDPNGLYTAGPAGGVTDVVQLRDSLGGTATRNVTVTAGVSIDPPVTSVAPGAGVTFTATGGSGTGWAWSLQTNASGATLGAASGAYVAGGATGTDVVRVRDSLGNSATAQVTVTANPLVIAPASVTVPPRGSRRFTASGGSGTGYAWSLAASPSGGIIDPTGLYTAGPTGGVTDVVELRDSLGDGASRAVTVTAGVSVSPPGATVRPGARIAFSAAGGSGAGWTWSLSPNASGATLDAASGAYVAGSVTATDVVHVRDSLGNVAAVEVTVSAAPPEPSLATRVTGSCSCGGGPGGAWALLALLAAVRPLRRRPPGPAAREGTAR